MKVIINLSLYVLSIINRIETLEVDHHQIAEKLKLGIKLYLLKYLGITKSLNSLKRIMNRFCKYDI